MSIKALEWAMDARRSGTMTPAARHVLIVLADVAHGDGTAAFRSVATIAAYTGLEERSVRRILARMITDGVITLGDQRHTTYLDAGHRPTVYDLPIDTVRVTGDPQVTPDRRVTPPLTDESGTPDPPVPGPLTDGSPKPSTNPTTRPKNPPRPRRAPHPSDEQVADAAASEATEAEELTLIEPPTETPAQAAKRITDEWWKAQDPTPRQPYPAALRIVRQAIDRDGATAARDLVLATPAPLSGAALDITARGRRGTRTAANDRTAPSRWDTDPNADY